MISVHGRDAIPQEEPRFRSTGTSSYGSLSILNSVKTGSCEGTDPGDDGLGEGAARKSKGGSRPSMPFSGFEDELASDGVVDFVGDTARR